MANKKLRSGVVRPMHDGEFTQFKRTIASSEIEETTGAAIADLIGEGRSYILPAIGAEIVTTADDVVAGHCSVETYKRPDKQAQRFLYIHPNFPKFLSEQCLDIQTHPDAERAAAVFARSLDVITSAFSKMQSRRSGDNGFRFSTTREDKFWTQEFRQGSRSVAFRAAATVALYSADLEDVDMKVSGPYAPHIAAFMNPLPRHSESTWQGFNVLSRVLLNGSRN